MTHPDRDNPRPPPPPLPYRATRDEPPYQPRTPLGWQIAAGFAAWFLGLIFVIVMANRAPRWAGMRGEDRVLWLIGAALVGIGGLAIWLRVRFRWRGFLPGLLIGFGLSCLLPIGIVAVICGFGGSRF